MTGFNYAWRLWCADFGGITSWEMPGVAASREDVSADLAVMKAAGGNVIRWWMFPRFLSDSILWDEDDDPSGIGGTMVEDIQVALELAEQHDLYLMLTLFSFDNFYPDQYEGETPIWSRSLKPFVVDGARQQRLFDNLIAPLAQAVEESPYKSRVLAWDLINEPEWAMAGPNLYGGEDFEPDPALDTVTHAQMEAFLSALTPILRANNPDALITIGGAAIKFATAWTHTDVDFYQLHYYDWVYEYYPYTTVTLESVGLTDRPVVMGEYPIGGLNAAGDLPARSGAELGLDLWDRGYAGFLAWAFNDDAFPWDPGAIRGFVDEHGCESAF